MKAEASITPLADLTDVLSQQDRFMGLDVGTKTIGLALASLSTSVATPLKTLLRRKYKDDIIMLKSLISEWEVRGLVFGLPLNMNGTEGARVQATKTVARNIARDTHLPYCFQDERLSSSAATDRMIALGIKPSARDRVIDAHAAQIILEGYMLRVKNALAK
ncbi:MAG: Holliday junction resolvase RuvX [Pseudomonadota bacterium]